MIDRRRHPLPAGLVFLLAARLQGRTDDGHCLLSVSEAASDGEDDVGSDEEAKAGLCARSRTPASLPPWAIPVYMPIPLG